MGFGLPAAIGAKVAAPQKTVIDVDGDASFSMTAMELATASQYGIGVKVLILNNEFQGMVLQWQGLYSFMFSRLARVFIDQFHGTRLVLQRSLFPHTHDKSRLYSPCTFDGRPRNSM